MSSAALTLPPGVHVSIRCAPGEQPPSKNESTKPEPKAFFPEPPILPISNPRLYAEPHQMCSFCRIIADHFYPLVFDEPNPSLSEDLWADVSTVTFKHHPSFRSLAKSAKAGCHICSLIWASFQTDLEGIGYGIEPKLQEPIPEDQPLQITITPEPSMEIAIEQSSRRGQVKCVYRSFPKDERCQTR